MSLGLLWDVQEELPCRQSDFSPPLGCLPQDGFGSLNLLGAELRLSRVTGWVWRAKALKAEKQSRHYRIIDTVKLEPGCLT